MGNSLQSATDVVVHRLQQQHQNEEEEYLPSIDEIASLIQDHIGRPLTEAEADPDHIQKLFDNTIQLLKLENQIINAVESQGKTLEQMTNREIHNLIKAEGYTGDSSYVDKAIHFLNEKECGPRNTKNRPAYTKNELVKYVARRGLLKKTQAKAKTKSQLCHVLGIAPHEEPEVIPEGSTKECGPRKSKAHPYVYDKEELVSIALARATELGMNSADIKKMSKNALCNLLFASGIPLPPIDQMPDEFSGRCDDYNLSQLKHLAKKHGLPSGGSKKVICERIMEKLNPLLPSDVSKETEPRDLEESKDPSCMMMPNLDFSLRDHQKNVVRHMLKHRGLIAIHSTGSGKTATAVAAMNCVLSNYPDVNVIFISPLSLLRNFTKELSKLGFDPENPIFKRRVKLYSKEAFFSQHKNSKELKNCNNTFLIIDEAHNLRAEVNLAGKKKTGAVAATIIKCAMKAFKVLLLTATPLKNRESDIINLIAMVDGVSYNEPRMKKTYFQKNVLEDDDLFEKFFACKISMNLLPKDDNYPKRIDQPIVKFVMTKEYYKGYFAVQEAQAKKFLIALYGDPSKFKLFYSALRRASLSLDKEKSPKVQWTFNKLQDANRTGNKVVVYSSWKQSGLNYVRRLLDEARIKYGMVSGDINEKLRDFYKNEFNKGNIKVLLISKAGGEGLDLTETRDIILMDTNWNSADDEQIIGRGIRYKSHSNLPPDQRTVNIWRLFMVKPSARLTKEDGKPDNEDSIDEILYKLSYSIKAPSIDNMLKRLEPLSIENMNCDCYFSGKSKKSCTLSPPVSRGRSPDVEEDISIDDDVLDWEIEEEQEKPRKFKRLRKEEYVPPSFGTSLIRPSSRSRSRSRSDNRPLSRSASKKKSKSYTELPKKFRLKNPLPDDQSGDEKFTEDATRKENEERGDQNPEEEKSYESSSSSSGVADELDNLPLDELIKYHIDN